VGPPAARRPGIREFVSTRRTLSGPRIFLLQCGIFKVDHFRPNGGKGAGRGRFCPSPTPLPSGYLLIVALSTTIRSLTRCLISTREDRFTCLFALCLRFQRFNRGPLSNTLLCTMTRRSSAGSAATLPTIANSTTQEKRRGSKGSCLCGCTGGITALWRKRMSASPELKIQVDQGVKSMVEKAQQVRKSGLQLYSSAYLFFADGRSNLNIVPPRREIRSPPTINSEHHFTRLKTLMQTLQGPGFYLDSGSYPSSCQWTSTVLTTLVIDYSHLTGDHQYLSHIVALFNNQEVPSLLKQKNDDKLWVVLTYLRGAAYASTHDPQWVQPFLDRALLFYNSASAGWDESTCGGGMYWGPRGWCWSYKNAVTTELWITASMGMYEAFGEESMLEAAIRGWVWFEKSGMINDQGLINDGLDRYCKYLSPKAATDVETTERRPGLIIRV